MAACSCIALLWMLSGASLNSHDSATDIRIEVMTTATTCRNTIRDMIDWNRSTLFFLGDEVADPADGMHLHLGAAVGALLAQAMDIDLDRVGSDLAGMAEDVILNLFLGDHAALASHQEFEHRGL